MSLLARRFAQQLARPSGMGGRLLGGAMDLANRRPTRLALDALAARSGERVLDVGCGTGAALATLLSEVAVEAWGIDPSAAMCAAARAKLGGRARIAEHTIEDMTLADGAFDAVLALNVLYFADEAGAMVRQLHRVIKPGGRLVAYVTDRASMAGWTFARQGLHRLYDAGQLHAALAAGGFAPAAIAVHEHRVAASVTGLVAVAVKEF